MTGQLPDDAITAAAIVFHDAHCGCLTDGHLRSYTDLARRALAAALPGLTGAITAQATTAERERIRPLVTAWQAMATEQDSRRSTMARAIHGARTGAYQACADALADLLGGTADSAHTPGGATCA